MCLVEQERAIPLSSELSRDIEKNKPHGSGEAISSCCCGEKHKARETEEYRDLIRRLNRIEGQVRGIKGMVERDCYCVDILTQVSAIQAALHAFNRTLLSSHIRSCVVDDIRAGNDEVVDELVDTIRKLMK
ncbi:MAG: metal-sensing transcriptional repressor [Lachnospiraceae bacterium]|nr:metal-sensing transcriptional repressor [Lachnospiraceae bacterium]